MIPLGVLASRRPAAAGATIVQFKSGSGSSVTFDAPPTPGNRLVISAANAVTDPAAWTYNHTGLSVDASVDRQGWDAAIISGTVASGASATVTITGMNASYRPNLCAWELSGVTGLADSDTSGLFGKSHTLEVASGSIAILSCMIQSGSGGGAATGMSTFQLNNNHGLHGSAVSLSLPFSTTVSWTTDRDSAAVLATYS